MQHRRRRHSRRRQRTPARHTGTITRTHGHAPRAQRDSKGAAVAMSRAGCGRMARGACASAAHAHHVAGAQRARARYARAIRRVWRSATCGCGDRGLLAASPSSSAHRRSVPRSVRRLLPWPAAAAAAAGLRRLVAAAARAQRTHRLPPAARAASATRAARRPTARPLPARPRSRAWPAARPPPHCQCRICSERRAPFVDSSLPGSRRGQRVSVTRTEGVHTPRAQAARRREGASVSVH